MRIFSSLKDGELILDDVSLLENIAYKWHLEQANRHGGFMGGGVTYVNYHYHIIVENEDNFTTMRVFYTQDQSFGTGDLTEKEASKKHSAMYGCWGFIRKRRIRKFISALLDILNAPKNIRV